MRVRLPPPAPSRAQHALHAITDRPQRRGRFAPLRAGRRVRQAVLMIESRRILSSNDFGATALSSNSLGDRIGAYFVVNRAAAAFEGRGDGAILHFHQSRRCWGLASTSKGQQHDHDFQRPPNHIPRRPRRFPPFCPPTGPALAQTRAYAVPAPPVRSGRSRPRRLGGGPACRRRRESSASRLDRIDGDLAAWRSVRHPTDRTRRTDDLPAAACFKRAAPHRRTLAAPGMAGSRRPDPPTQGPSRQPTAERTEPPLRLRLQTAQRPCRRPLHRRPLWMRSAFSRTFGATRCGSASGQTTPPQSMHS